GVAAVERVIKKLFLNDADEQSAGPDPKSNLQMWLQARGMPLPNYELISVTGPSHNPEFTVRLRMYGFDHSASDRTRKGAEAKTAMLMLEDLKEKEKNEK
ncbi:MAG: ribonuclease III family protein, partial [Synergistaceae bacterium]|nr:ribonuclease III family protein [Synergistaceae bacterium]